MAGFAFTVLDKFPDEQRRIGRLMLAYNELELNLVQCVAAYFGEDIAVKALYRTRGETQRIIIADGLVRFKYIEAGYETMFCEMIGNLNFSLSIRNLYAHCSWIGKPGDTLAFVNIEESALLNKPFSPSVIDVYLTDAELLKKQEEFFYYVDQCQDYLVKAVTWVPGSASPKPSKPKVVQRPLRHKQKSLAAERHKGKVETPLP